MCNNCLLANLIIVALGYLFRYLQLCVRLKKLVAYCKFARHLLLVITLSENGALHAIRRA